MEKQTQENIERAKKPSLLERFGAYLASLEGKRIDYSLREKGFFRTDNRTDDASLQHFIEETYKESSSRFLTELYIAPAVLFGETEKKYVVYMRTKTCREQQTERGQRI